MLNNKNTNDYIYRLIYVKLHNIKIKSNLEMIYKEIYCKLFKN